MQAYQKTITKNHKAYKLQNKCFFLTRLNPPLAGTQLRFLLGMRIKMSFKYKKRTPRIVAKTSSYKGDFISLNPKIITIPVRVRKLRRNRLNGKI